MTSVARAPRFWARTPAAFLLVAMLVLAGLAVTPGKARAAGPCDPPVTSPIACENSKPGTPQSDWDVSAGGSASIEGFATDISVNKGQTVRFKIRTNAHAYTIEIFRMGYYQGNGARRVATINPSASLPQNQPACSSNSTTGLVDCGNWGESASWAVPASAVSGIYFALLTRTDNEETNHIPFVVRDDASTSDLLFQTADTTWQAYNRWGGSSTYTSESLPQGRAYKVSYNRPFATRKCCDEDFVFSMEYPMVRWLEANGYDVSYTSGIDTDRRGSLITQHQAFLSVGHDEYWSKQQRANVEAARDAGVNLAFFSGNEMFWKIRWEDSADGTGTPYRTLVVYKETRADAKIDPSPEWTGTWRDPRFSPPSDGGRPENAVTGTMYMVDCCAFPMKVPAADGKMRLWRNTSVANLAPGATATLAENTLGYEWDVDADNGFRPPGLIRMSTTTESTPYVLQDYGKTTGQGTATHHLTLYRAPSGALVFGAGTIQWSWGLDDVHDASRNQEVPAPDVRMRQATVNLLADMGVQPATLQPGLTAATASTDTAAPTATVTAPATGANIQVGQQVTIAGTATDTGGGRVGGVEVSTDGGATWHPANGRESWTYTWNASGIGATQIRARAADDSANLGVPSAGVDVNVRCPCSIWPDSATPKVPADSDSNAIELGVKFRADTDGFVTGIRFYKGAGNSGTHTGSLWSTDGTRLATATFTGETASGWQEVSFAESVAVTAGTTYVASYLAPNGRYAADAGAFTAAGVDTPPLHALRAGVDGSNGVFRYGGGYPTSSFGDANYWVDVVFDTATGPDVSPPRVVGQTPPAGDVDVSVTTTVTARFSEAVTPSSVAFTVKEPNGTSVAGTLAYDPAARTSTFTPSAPLRAGVIHTATVSGATDAAGNTMNPPVSWSFTTAGPRECPCTIFSAAATPAVPAANDPDPVELGVKFRTDVNGFIHGVRFYKGAGNSGAHTGSLWSATGTRLATATFTGETASGWQQVSFDSPVAVTANTTYVASYHAPGGHYAINTNGFASAGAGTAPIRALGNGVDGGNGVYRYGSGGAAPTSTFNASNYWVDAVFSTDPGPPDTTPPTVTARTPASGATDVAVSSNVTATFSEQVGAGSIGFTLKDPGGATVAATTSYDETTKTVTLDPDATLVAGRTYTATVSGATDAGGNTLAAPVTWSFTTAAAGCPCSVWPSSTTPGTAASSDTGAIEVGVKLRADVDGWITAIRFYKGAGNTGTHVGSLWSATGTRLALALFENETASGWQQASLDQPVAVTAGTTYVASYHAPNGHYAADSGFFAGQGAGSGPLRALRAGTDGPNGVFRYGGASNFPTSSHQSSNYWVDAAFTTTQPAPDTTAPAVATKTPAAGATGVAATTSPTATFSEQVAGSSVAFTLERTSTGGAVAADLGYDPLTRTATLDPDSSLVAGASYTATVGQATDLADNDLAAPVSWSFTVAAAGCPCSIWSAGTTPANPSSSDNGAIELGVKFRPDVDGLVTGVRFYKGAGNTGTHTGRLWSASGQQLATATFSGESATGWQEVSFSEPVAVTAGTTYVASYHAPNGGYAYDSAAFASSGAGSGPVRALRSGVDGPNGVFRYGAGGVFPTSSFNSTNYWVDVVFTPA
jgi:hypothetical protein